MFSAKSARKDGNIVIDLNLNNEITFDVFFKNFVLRSRQSLGRIAFEFINLCKR